MEQLPRGTSAISGTVRAASIDEGWTQSTNKVSKKGLFLAARYIADTQLHIENMVAVRIGNGVKTLSKLHGYESSIILFWKPRKLYDVSIIECDTSSPNVIDAVRMNIVTNDWSNVRTLQFLCRTSAQDDDKTHDISPNDTSHLDTSTLSPIPEEPSDS